MIKLLSLFSGIGAFEKALKNIGLNYELVGFSEIDKFAIKSYCAIHNENEEKNLGDITKIDITKLPKDIDLITHGSPCFLAGEKVNTIQGFKNIEDIKIGDLVKSHNGKYNKVIKIMRNLCDDIYDISCSATHNINTTYNHPFYILRNKKHQWIQTKDLTEKDFMCIPVNKNQFEIEDNKDLPVKDNRFWYLVGRFIGDGWVVRRKARNNNISGIKICCSKDELNELKSKLDNILHYCIIEDKTTYKLQFCNKKLGEFCEQFGVGAINKHIPQWVLDLKKEYLEYLLMGIIESDGCYSQNKYKVTTISRDLAYNIGELVLKVKKVPYHIYKDIRPKKYIIQNRLVNQNNTYQITWSNIYNKNINYVDENYLYSRIRKIEERLEFNNVYNIEVENTHTYCVNNIAVHNCQDFSIAGKQAGGDLGTGTRSSLMWNTINIVTYCKPKYIIWENVKNLLSKKHRHNFDSYLSIMESLGYNNYYKVLNAKDYGIPQNRERIYTISIRKDIDDNSFNFPEKEELKLKLKDMLEDEVDEKYYLSDEQVYKIKFSTYTQNKRRIQEKEYCDTLCARDWKDPKCIIENNIIGKLEMNKWQDHMKRIYNINSYSPTIGTMQGGNTEPKILIKNATKKGYIEAKDGDSVNLSYPTSNTKRGRVGKEVSQTLQCNDMMGVINSEMRIRKLTPKECWRLMRI